MQVKHLAYIFLVSACWAAPLSNDDKKDDSTEPSSTTTTPECAQNVTEYFDQRQTGDTNVRVKVKNLEIMALPLEMAVLAALEGKTCHGPECIQKHPQSKTNLHSKLGFLFNMFKSENAIQQDLRNE